MTGYNYENQGTGYDPGAAGHELQGRAARPREAAPHPDLIRRIQKQADELRLDAEANPDLGEQTKSAIRCANLTHAVSYLSDYARLSQPVNPWRVMEVAPRDGPVMLWFPDFIGAETQIGYWHIYEDAPWTQGEWRDRDNGEPFETGGASGCQVFPTRWAPMPPEPEELEI